MKTLISLLFLLATFVSYSQNWQTYFSDSKVDIQFAVVNHDTPSHHRSHERILFKYVNKSAEPLTINFDRPLAYDGQDLPTSSERNFTIELSANSELSFNRETNKSKLFYIFSKDNNDIIKRRLTAFDIINFKYQ